MGNGDSRNAADFKAYIIFAIKFDQNTAFYFLHFKIFLIAFGTYVPVLQEQWTQQVTFLEFDKESLFHQGLGNVFEKFHKINVLLDIM